MLIQLVVSLGRVALDLRGGNALSCLTSGKVARNLINSREYFLKALLFIEWSRMKRKWRDSANCNTNLTSSDICSRDVWSLRHILIFKMHGQTSETLYTKKVLIHRLYIIDQKEHRCNIKSLKDVSLALPHLLLYVREAAKSLDWAAQNIFNK